MTQAIDIPDVLNRLDRLTTAVEGMNSNLQELRLEVKTFQARTEEKLNAIDQRFVDLGKRIDSLEQRNIAQDVRFWGFLGIIVTALIGLLSKLAFFPGGTA
jgi:predicted nuclease with TOPRIM domain